MTKDEIIPKMKELADLIGYEYDNVEHLSNAMHCQIVHKQTDGKNRKNYTNDSYATLGDALLKLILTEYLFDRGYDKGEITIRKQNLENNNTLFDLCNDCGIYKYAYNDFCFSTSAPLENRVYNSKHDIYIEAIIAAIYKDKGFDFCKRWVLSFFSKT